MGFQMVPRSNARIALGVDMRPPGPPQLRMMAQDSPLDNTIWDLRVMFWGGEIAPNSVLGSDPHDYGDSFHSWIFGPKATMAAPVRR